MHFRRWLLLASFLVLGNAATAAPPAETRLFAPDPQAEGLFGYAAGVSGNLMVVGAFLQDGAVPSSGAAYVFERREGRWLPQAKLAADDGQVFDWFGASAAISGDTVVVGAPQVTDEQGRAIGAAYVFRRVGGRWVQEARLVADDPRDFADFAFDQGVSISGDTIVVGAARAVTVRSPASIQFGKAYVFERRNGVWSQTATLVQPEGEFNADYGTSVSISGPVIVVGADFATASGVAAAGAAYVYRRQQGSWILEAKLQAPVPQAVSFFGASTAIDKDTLLLGGFNAADAQGRATGGGWIFERKGAAWLPTATLFPADGADHDDFGNRVALGGDTAVVGSLLHVDAKGHASGAAYVYRRAGGRWPLQYELQASDGQDFGEFSCSLATDGKTLLVGAGHVAGPQGADVGEAYVYRLGTD